MFLSTAVVAIVVLTGIVLSTRSTPKASSAPAGTGDSVLRGETVRLLVVGMR
ncbi:MAG TPA: hypothetical protein VFZ09_31055 [Archangium sp.]|uniref:hypothetical protein n=1 Tax=Archangium sp. TaxID=1872627 RepID=UPI002E312C14|nr:hypothetical protein [Archangium sp.]HEX5750707.1 hypothetical protein [Archangium sp.]